MTTPDPQKRISYQPTPGLSYDPSEAKYWDRAALEGEVRRAFEICHGCRMCFKYCDSFPRLFTLHRPAARRRRPAARRGRRRGR